MDSVQRSHYGLHFRDAFLSQRGAAFQDWFVRLAGFAFGADFEEVRPYGNRGDLKCDGWRPSTGTIFQCYAPDAMKDTRVITKVKEDFHGAQHHWAGRMQKWVLVHNDDQGLSARVIQYLDDLRKTHAPLKIAVWSYPELYSLAMELPLTALESLFGSAPSLEIMDRLVLPDLVPVLEALERRDPDPANPPLTPPSPEKLEKNALSEDAGHLLQVGRRKASLAGDFFSKDPRPARSEAIAEAFRQDYVYLKSLNLLPDTIFKHLQDKAGHNGDPKRQTAALAVLAYFFDSCDIFEDRVVSEQDA